MKTILFILVSFILVPNASFSQKIIINGENTQRKLVWSDFIGKVDKGTSFLAYTSYRITPKYEDVKVVGDSISIGKFEIEVEFDAKNSWAKQDKVSDELLIHEQGHFNIGILYMREVLAVYKKTRFNKSNFSSSIQNIMNDAFKKYNTMGVTYDTETDHSKNNEQQKKWNLFFEEKLKEI